MKKIDRQLILAGSALKTFSLMDQKVLVELGNFVREFNKREWTVRIAKECTFNEYYEKGLYDHRDEFKHGFVIGGRAVPYFHPNRSFHDEIIWLNDNLFFDPTVSFENKLLNSAIVKFYGPSQTLKMIVEDTDWKYVNFAVFDSDPKYQHKVMSNIERGKQQKRQIWGTTELRTSLQTASRNYAREYPSIIDEKGSDCKTIKPILSEERATRQMRPSDMIHWINHLGKSWVPAYRNKPTMEESFKLLTSIRGIGNYYGYHFSSNLARMPEVGSATIIDAEYRKQFNELQRLSGGPKKFKHGNLDEDADYVVAGPGSSATIQRLFPTVSLNLEVSQKIIIDIRNNQEYFFKIDDEESQKHLREASEIGRFTTFGCEISCCQFNVFSRCKSDIKMANNRANAPISIEAGQDSDAASCAIPTEFFS